MKHDPNQGSLFGSDPQNPAPVPVPPERVAAELPGQLFLPIAPVALPPLDVKGAALDAIKAAPLGWKPATYFGAPAVSRLYANTDLECIVWQEASTAWGWCVVRSSPKGAEPIATARKPVLTQDDAKRAALNAVEAHLAPRDWRRGLDVTP